jgi:hypothetical protein
MTEAAKTKPSRKTLKKKGRDKRTEKLKTDPAFKKTFMESKAKRAADKKAAFRKKKKGKK